VVCGGGIWREDRWRRSTITARNGCDEHHEKELDRIPAIDASMQWLNLHPSPWAEAMLSETFFYSNDFKYTDVVYSNLSPLLLRSSERPAR